MTYLKLRLTDCPRRKACSMTWTIEVNVARDSLSRQLIIRAFDDFSPSKLSPQRQMIPRGTTLITSIHYQLPLLHLMATDGLIS